ncbi:MAG: glycoside hydrolase family 13 protein [Lachnospiraceae bacterium]|nr:glycoside hydrolase family 13 protein [Lachnospiraceae bacterium]
MNREAIFSDGTAEYRIPTEPMPGESVHIILRTAKDDVTSACLRTEGDDRVVMLKYRTDDRFDYYKTTVRMNEDSFIYYFEIQSGPEIVYLDRFGVSEDVRPTYRFCIAPGFSVPDWAKGAVMYQILVDRFFCGDPTNSVETDEYNYISGHVHHVEQWDRFPKEFDVTEFYGGDLEGVRQKLNYLKSLGVEVIYFNPIFVSPSNHKYDTQDYDYIDPHFGKIVHDGGELLQEGDGDNSHATKYIRRVTDKANLEASNQFFADFVAEAHRKGIRVILDGVFNHCGSFNKWLDREKLYEHEPGYPPGAYISEESPYRDFFHFYNDKDWPYNGSYDGWWGHDTLPKLNYENSESLCDYVLQVAAKWVSPPYNCDGWRLDVAADLGHSEEFNHQFWNRFRKAVKTANPQAVILAEHYGDARSWLSGKEWDTIMNYDAFMEPVSFFFTGMEKHSDRFEWDAVGDGKRFEMTMRHCMSMFMTPSLYCAMNELSNHDHSRFLTRTNHKVGRVAQLGSQAASEDIDIAILKEAVVMQLTWPGAPTIYYADEAGQVGFTDPDNRRTYPWGKERTDLIDFHRDVIFLHRKSEALRLGSFMFLETGRHLVSYARFTSKEQVIVAINSGGDSIEVALPVWQADVPWNCTIQQVLVVYRSGHSIMPIERAVEGGRLVMSLKPYTSVVLRHIS